MLPIHENFINGRFIPSPAHFDVINPTTGAVLSKAPASTGADVDQALAAVRAARASWPLLRPTSSN